MRRKWIYDPERKEMVEVTAGYQSPQRGDAINHLGGLWGDRHYDGLKTTDGADISSRKKHREYMKRNGLTTADDFNNEWTARRKERENYMQRGGSIRRQDIERVISRLTNKR